MDRLSERIGRAWGGDAEAEFLGVGKGFAGCVVGVMHEDDHLSDIGRECRKFVDGGVDGVRIGRGEIDFVEDGGDILFEECLDKLSGERAVGREGDRVLKRDAERGFLRGMDDGEDAALKAEDVEGLFGTDDMDVGVVFKCCDFGFAVLVDEGFHGRAQAVFPEV